MLDTYRIICNGNSLWFKWEVWVNGEYQAVCSRGFMVDHVGTRYSKAFHTEGAAQNYVAYQTAIQDFKQENV